MRSWAKERRLESGYRFLILFLGITLIVSGIRSLVYYISMARHMVGGRNILYQSIIVLDLGLFTLNLSDVPLIFIVLYLAALHGFSGFVDFMRAVEAKRMQAGSWKLNLNHGIINMIMAVLCIVFLHTAYVSVVIYSLGIMYSGLIRIIQAFRRTKVVYIQ